MPAKPLTREGPHALPAAPPGLFVPRILLPAPSADLFRWSVIACDQHTANLSYWQETARIVGDSPSTLQLVLPEYYLEHPDDRSLSSRIDAINRTMDRYLAEGLLRELEPGCMLVDRQTPEHASRLGLVIAVDLEHYDFTPGNRQLIRATEGTVMERIPPRAQIRRHAALELPHIQLLVDDPGRQVIEPLLRAVRRSGQSPVYETCLMQGGGSVRGWFFPAADPVLAQALQAMANLPGVVKNNLMLAVGDGNHSLATAKAHWEHVREQAGPEHPARYALVEIVNLHDDGLVFEPIHRILDGMTPDKFQALARDWFKGQDMSVISGPPPDTHDWPLAIPVLAPGQAFSLVFGRPRDRLAAALLQPFLDHLCAGFDVRVDYIHGRGEVERLAGQGQIGLLLPALDKADFFPTLARDGIYPRKTFSMGEAHEKRYYMECRRIR